jgi:predicted nucleotidyltransferase
MLMPFQLKDAEHGEVKTAVNILKEYVVNRIFLFGSVAKSKHRSHSDIDLACEGISPERFFKALGELLSTTRGSIDPVDILVDIKEVKDTLRKRIEGEGILIYEAK